MDKRFDKLLSLHADDKVTPEQFMRQNERIVQQQQGLANKKAELIVLFDAR
ncbi:hypothetical protein ACFFF5_18075 [Lederbergia wuyishanensis]|uniref:Uncharacterized protein n=1 Tax=Lederbergia wuyishanensis TaxID=1347903 RepID=A0ABU0D4M9_9BACI|nr:hypothetical protein [Lederbergia wuyishanensis]MCJ8008065.1 hypothetical protein [Lederbergia wuyishanensis]MDQ0343350.1 hypothetical protein [Lederbergia wuyishanensis]